MPFAFAAAIGGVELEDVAVTMLQLLQDGGLVDYAGTKSPLRRTESLPYWP